MTSFEYASGLTSIVVGLGIARVLGGIGSFSDARERTPDDWIVAGWCVALLVNLVGWWLDGWIGLRADRIYIGALMYWVLNTCLLYLGAYVITSHSPASDGLRGPVSGPRRTALVFVSAHWFIHGLWMLLTGAWVVHIGTAFVGGALLLAGVWVKSIRARAIHLSGYVTIEALAIPAIFPSIG